MSNSQKYIKIISIIDIVFGVLGLIVSAAAATGGFVLASGATGADVAATDAMGFGAAMVIVALSSIFTIIVGILGLRAAKDASKVKPLFVVSIISLAVGVVSVILSVTGGTFKVSDLSGLVGSALMVFCANNVRKQAQG